MRPYAQTYPQLMNQARALNGSADELRELKATHGLAEAMSDGLYRAAGVPFLHHLVRTASITMADGYPPVVVRAALLHAAGFLHGFEASRRERPGGVQRRAVREAAGHDVERLLFEVYARLPWRGLDDLAAHRRDLADYDEASRRAVAIRLANELEDYLDGAMAYADPKVDRLATVARRDDCAALAEALGLDPLAHDLREAFDGHLAGTVLPELGSGHRIGYERPRAHLWEQTDP